MPQPTSSPGCAAYSLAYRLAKHQALQAQCLAQLAPVGTNMDDPMGKMVILWEMMGIYWDNYYHDLPLNNDEL